VKRSISLALFGGEMIAFSVDSVTPTPQTWSGLHSRSSTLLLAVVRFVRLQQAVIVTCPAARAERSGGSLLDRLTMVELLDVQVNPVTGCPAALKALNRMGIPHRQVEHVEP